MNTQAKKNFSLKAALLFVVVLLLNVFVHGAIFMLFRDSTLNPLLTALFAVIWGVAGVYLLYLSFSWAVEQFPEQISRRMLPYVFIE